MAFFVAVCYNCSHDKENKIFDDADVDGE